MSLSDVEVGIEVLEWMEEPRRFWDCDWGIPFFLRVPALIADSRDSFTILSASDWEGVAYLAVA